MNGLLNYLIEGSLMIGIGLISYKLFFERLTFFQGNRAVLLGIVFVSLFLPLITLDFTFLDTTSVETLSSSMQWVETKVITNNLDSEEFAFSWQSVLMLGYFVGVLFTFTRLILGVAKMMLMIRYSFIAQYAGMTIMVNPKFVPSSFFKRILLPSFDPENEEHQQIILHESVHVDLRHSIDVMLIQLTKVVFWFNPLIYRLEKYLREIHEFQADQIVTQSYSPISYSRLLLKQLSADCGLQFMNNFNQFQTKKRIIMMNKTKSNSMLKSRFLLTVPLLVLMIGLFSCDMAGNDRKIVGIWIGSDFSFEQSTGPDMTAVIEGGKQLHKDGKLIIREDGTYEIVVGQNDVNGSGVWKLEGGNLITTDSGDNVTVYEITELSSDKLQTVHEVTMDTPMGTVAGKITLTYSR
ncbi:M56 family metallopeptidase [Algoriphagus sp. D3-2-R+10]|uniref:M56 family metallopeptidase n=1 Tax=Algoriphagus aurantiacus TaxID=3103948 RepID=UPI002B3C42AE|nr:M56 family metallopeptidase [Algoriphagus sp. D3-2-R+10]MEB2777192.1 M56 family metallopeptidase [Algoriphagus sp. D3-2-R+10]